MRAFIDILSMLLIALGFYVLGHYNMLDPVFQAIISLIS